jgi:uncharacterized protein (TIGR02118 family)
VFSLFLIFREANPVDDAMLLSTGANRAHVYTPETAKDPFLNDGAPPPLALQLYFADLAILEQACAGALSVFKSCAAQAMAVRRFAVPNPGTPGCTYLVAYEGPAQDERAWLAHYLEHHPPLMARLPAIRELEVYTRIDWVSPPAWERVSCMQRNKVAFDSAQALSAALDSPVRHEMRADFRRLPPFAGAVTHFPMATRIIAVSP